MSSLEFIGLLGVLCVLTGVCAGVLAGHRTFVRDIPDGALALSGLLVASFGFLALVSYLGFLIYPPGLFVFGVGVGRFAKNLAA